MRLYRYSSAAKVEFEVTSSNIRKSSNESFEVNRISGSRLSMQLRVTYHGI
jgi:hypothetical protein